MNFLTQSGALVALFNQADGRTTGYGDMYYVGLLSRETLINYPILR